jgi:hypothetical protein
MMFGFLRSLNTHLVGYVGVATGGVTILGALAALFGLLGDANYDVALYMAIVHAHKHTSDQTDILTIGKLVAASISVFGGFVTALVSSYFGRPATVKAG